MKLHKLMFALKNMDSVEIAAKGPSNTVTDEEAVAILLVSKIDWKIISVLKSRLMNTYSNATPIRYSGLKRFLRYIVDDSTITKKEMLQYLDAGSVEVIRPTKSTNAKIEPIFLTNDLEAVLFDNQYDDNSLSRKDLKVLFTPPESRYMPLVSFSTLKISNVVYKKVKKNKTTLAFLMGNFEFVKDAEIHKEVSAVSSNRIVPNTLGLLRTDVTASVVIATKDILPSNIRDLLYLYIAAKAGHKLRSILFDTIKSHPDFTIGDSAAMSDLAKLFTKDTYD